MGAILVETTTLCVCLSGSYFALKDPCISVLEFLLLLQALLYTEKYFQVCLRNVTHGAMVLTFTGCVYVGAGDTWLLVLSWALCKDIHL